MLYINGIQDMDDLQTVAGVTVLDIEAIIRVCTLKGPADVKTAFQEANGMLLADGFSPDMLSCYVNTMCKVPHPKQVVEFIELENLRKS